MVLATPPLPDNALFVCFGAMSNVGTLSGLASLEAIKRAVPGKAGIFCLGGLPTGAHMVLEKSRSAKRILTVDGCTLNCARKIVEAAGFVPVRSITLVDDCGIKKQGTFQYTEEDFETCVDTILEALDGE